METVAIPDGERAKDLLARSLDRLMRKAGITQTALAKRSGINKTTLNTYFTRKSFPSRAKLQALAEALEVSIEDLGAGTEGGELDDPVPEQAESAGTPFYSVSAIPGRPKHSKVVVRADLPTDVALRIIALVIEADAGGEA